MSPDHTPLWWAKQYRQLGWSVIPVRARKKGGALVSWKPYQNRRPTEKELEEWWDRDNPPGIAVVTGKISGIIALDLDRHGEDDGVRVAKSLYGWQPEGPLSQTGGGGLHALYAHPGYTVPNQASIDPGVDLRGDGGFIYAPPSIHPTGNPYEWQVSPLDEAIPEMPEWLADAVKEETRGAAEEAGATDELDRALQYGVDEGNRNDTAARLAGRAFARGASKNEVLALLLEWNRRNRPPLEEKEVRDVVDSIARREAVRTGEDDGDGTDRETALEGLSERFDIPLTDIVRIEGDSPKYRFEFANGEEVEVRAEDCLSQYKWRRAIAAGAQQVPTKISSKGSGPGFDHFVQVFFDLARHVDPGEEARLKGQLRLWLQSYLEECPPADKDECSDIPDQPRYRNGDLFIHLPDFRRFIDSQFRRRINGQQMAQIFSAEGGWRETINVETPRGRSTRSLWTVPEHLLGGPSDDDDE